MFTQEVYEVPVIVQNDIKCHYPNNNLVYDNNPRDLNSILQKIQTVVKEQYPELSKYLDDMLSSIPNDRNPKIIRFQS